MKLRKFALGILLATNAVAATAMEKFEQSNHMVSGIGYMNLSDEDEGLEISLGGIYGSLGYQIQTDDNLYMIPEVRLGAGIQDEVFVF